MFLSFLTQSTELFGKDLLFCFRWQKKEHQAYIQRGKVSAKKRNEVKKLESKKAFWNLVSRTLGIVSRVQVLRKIRLQYEVYYVELSLRNKKCICVMTFGNGRH